MGQELQHMNVEAISVITVFSSRELEFLLSFYEKYYLPKRGDYILSLQELLQLLGHTNLHKSDKEILQNLYFIADVNGFQKLCIKELLTSFCVLYKGSLQSRISMAYLLYDREKKGLVNREQLLKVLYLLNKGCTYFGDRPLSESQLNDIVDSLYTGAGLIDGSISYMDFIDTMMKHPLLEMFLSPQFQGLASSKSTTNAYI